ncbi:hypothetical protein [Gayadomonas joobiniege]|uniref:hypothetical protein n=1 Tax=Gayadomonas joobiniege TaxID=1234606 RepID=UPI0003765D29|nr:hypothetical protein [Gayadomonas joobiniege]
MRPRPKNLKQIMREKWPEQASSQKINNEYNSELSNELELYLPENLHKQVSIEGFKQGLLELTVPTATQLLVLNRQRSQLISQLRKNNPQLISIKCSVKPVSQQRYNTAQPTPERKLKNQLSARSRQHLEDFLATAPEELKGALERLLDKKSN